MDVAQSKIAALQTVQNDYSPDFMHDVWRHWIILGIDLHAFPRAEGAKNVVEDPAVTSSADAKNHVDVDW